MCRLPGENLKKVIFFFKLSPIADLNFEFFLLCYLKNITARIVKLGQLLQDDVLIISGENKKKYMYMYFFFRTISLCRFGLKKYPIMISEE